MKLRNKRTGEIIDIYKGNITLHYSQGRKTIHFKRLEDLDDWEDYEEPHETYRLTSYGEVVRFSSDSLSNAQKRDCVNIGNHFSTEAEAEQTLEKLKAWKRLKDGGFRFKGWNAYGEIRFSMGYNKVYSSLEDLDLLFGGEE